MISLVAGYSPNAIHISLLKLLSHWDFELIHTGIIDGDDTCMI